jgi:hypothetical protein
MSIFENNRIKMNENKLEHGLSISMDFPVLILISHNLISIK